MAQGVDFNYPGSAKNSTSAVLGIAGVFTGGADAISITEPSQSVTVTAFSDVASAADGLELRFSMDGSNWDHVEKYTVSAGVSTSFESNIRHRYFQVKYTNGGTGQAAFRLQTIYNSRFGADSTATNPIVVRHSDGTKFGALTVDGAGAFGDVITAELTPLAQMDFVYGAHADLATELTIGTGVISYDLAMAAVSSGANQGGTAFLQTRRVVRYRPGQGALFRFTGLFDTPVVGVHQSVGAFGFSENALLFGYDFEDAQARFGVAHISGGLRHIHQIEMTAAATGAETYTITLDGVAFDVPLTAGTIEENAGEIAAFTFAGPAFNIWSAEADGEFVYFLNNDAAPRTGAFTESSTGTAAGTLTERSPGVLAVNDWIPQEDWNEDKLDGTGPSKMVLDPTKLNVFQIRMQFLGAGAIEFGVEAPSTGRFVCVHRFALANVNVLPSSNNPTYTLGVAAAAIDAAGDVTVKSASLSGFVEGQQRVLGPNHGAKTDGNAGAEIPVLSVRNNRIFVDGLSRANLRDIFASVVSMATSGSNKSIQAFVLLNAELTDPLWVNHTSAPRHAFASVDVSATAASGGDVVFATSFPSGGGFIFDLLSKDIVLMPGDMLTLVISPTGIAADYTASILWKEDA